MNKSVRIHTGEGRVVDCEREAAPDELPEEHVREAQN